MWASVGSGESAGDGDWVATIDTLIGVGASVEHAWVEGKSPSEAVAALLYIHGVEAP